MCPLQIIKDVVPLLLTIHRVNACFIHHSSNVNQKKKVHPSYIFLHLSANFWFKIQNTHRYRNLATFLTSLQSALNGPANGLEVTYSKIQNRLSRAPQDTPMDRFLIEYMSNKCTLILHESVKKVVLNFRQPVAPPKCFGLGNKLAHDLA